VVPGTSAGVVAAAGLPGNTTGSAIAAGYVGEYKSATINLTAINSTTPTNVTNDLSLTAGIWLINFFDTSYRSTVPTSATNSTACARIRNITDNTTLAEVTGYHYITNVTGDYEGAYNGGFHLSCIVNIATTKSFRGQLFLNAATGAVTNRGVGSFYAVRIA
jgi:hypothetical protein